jgi:hypothetical protein
MSLTLPKPVTNYLAAVEAKDTDMLALCFANDALVLERGTRKFGQCGKW